MPGRNAALGGLFGLMVAAGVQAQSPAGPAVWINDHARFTVQSVDATGRLTGTYENFGFQCAGFAYPVTGWLDGDRMTFAVRRADPRGCTPIESWTGMIRDDHLWVEFHAILWNGTQWVVVSGSDRYRRQ